MNRPNVTPRPVVVSIWTMMPIAARMSASFAAAMTPSIIPSTSRRRLGRYGAGRANERTASSAIPLNPATPPESRMYGSINRAPKATIQLKHSDSD
ncbi:hypothetical protein [Sediminicurvatus halobius]|uniref:hypothetical protein n=1 Tax=Sediminicurvatus halobius TaxID=2182432 RepID=UPI0013048F9E|nr:hypothetical protein [Spiribacter halobius]UEX79199.1 hypothetical protein LMH63_06060 [Spiribacter halobius]